MVKASKKTVDIGDAPGARDKALERTLAEIGKRYGNESIMRLGDNPIVPVEVISTGSLSLDWALGVGGVPRGRIVECFGPESSGKTTLALHIVANCQKRGGVAAFIDAEHALDPAYARRLGVNLENLLVSQPDCGEQALEITELLVRSGAVDVIVIDSVAALVPRSELEGEMGDAQVGVQARLMSQAMRKLTAVVKKSNACILFINQIRMKIGVMFGSPETTPGGRALKFYSSVRLDIRRVGSIKRGEEVVGNQVKVTVVKNKVAAPFRHGNFEVFFSEGIHANGELLDLGVEHKLVDKSGTWLSYGETRLGQGRERAAEFLRENPAVRDELDRSLRAILFANLLDKGAESGKPLKEKVA
ncbi:MAG: recombinase RecA [Planctomycetota bacterium]